MWLARVTLLCVISVAALDAFAVKRNQKSRDGVHVGSYLINKGGSPMQPQDHYGSVFDFDYRPRNGLHDGYNVERVRTPMDKRGGTLSELLAKLGELTGNRDLFGPEARRLRFGPGRR